MTQLVPHAGWPKINTSWWPDVSKSWKFDLIAGLTVWGLVIPESIAYTSLANVKPIAGIWAIVLVLPAYVLFGRSHQLIATPTAATAVTAGGIILTMHPKHPGYAMGVIAICTGLWFMVAYFFKLGFIVHFISEPINAGFMFGLATFLTVSQLPKMLGFSGGKGNTIRRGWFILQHLDKTNWTVVALTLLCIAIMFGLPKLFPRLPVGLVALVVTTVIVGVFSLHSTRHVDVVGKIPTGFPGLIDPKGSLEDLWTIIVGSIGVLLLGFSEASGVATDLAAEHGHDYHAEDDLFAFGLGNVASGMVGGLVGVGSMSSSGTNAAAGGKTPLSSLVVAVAALMTALFAGGLLKNLPEATLGVLIVHAIANHLRLRFVGRIDRYSPAEMGIALLAAGGVIVFDVLYGLLIAMAASLVWFLYRTTKVRTEQLGRNANDHSMLVSTNASDYEPLPSSELAFRFAGDLFYGNVDSACVAITDRVAAARTAHPDTKPKLILDLSDETFLDYTTVRRLRRLFDRLIKECRSITLITHTKIANELTVDGPLPKQVTWVGALDPVPNRATPVDRSTKSPDDSTSSHHKADRGTSKPDG